MLDSLRLVKLTIDDTASIFFHEDGMIIKTIEIGTCVLLHLSALESKSVHLNFTISVCMYL